MGTGWRRAFCTTIPRGKESGEKSNKVSETASPEPLRSCAKLRLFSSISNPTTPKASSALHCRTSSASEPQSTTETSTPTLHCKTKKPGRKIAASAPSSPRSPFSIFKFTKSGCGVCLQSVKAGNGTAIYTAECSHAFHFPCIAQHVRKQGSMVCPVCCATWKDAPLFSAHKTTTTTTPFPDQDDVVEKTITTTGAHRILMEDKKIQSSIPSVKTKNDRSEPSVFSDDEPLLSPTSGARFNPIPEADEEENEEEFKGFFVNQTAKSAATASGQRAVEIKLLPETAVISAGRNHETFAVALRVKAPPPPLLSPSHRAPIDLVAVLDVGGSMDGAKLHMVKRAMRLLISSLGASDRISIVAFSSASTRLLPLRRMTSHGQRLARRVVDELSLSSGEGKSVTSALKVAARVLEGRREKNPVASIILLSDGQENKEEGEGTQNVCASQRQSRSHVSAARFGHIEIPVQVQGHHDSVADAFARRVGGLLSVVAQDLRLQLGFSSGSAPGEISAVYSCNVRPRLLTCDSVRLGDLYAEEEREILVELRVPTSAIGSHHVLSVRCSYRDPPSGEVMYERERALLVPRPHAVRSSDPRIERLRNLFVATRAVAEARRVAEHGEFGSAQQLLESARALVAQSGSGSAEEYSRWLEGELAEIQRRKRSQVQRREQELMAAQKRRHHQHEAMVDENGEPLTPTSAWRAAERLAKVAMMKKSLSRANDLHGFENARF